MLKRLFVSLGFLFLLTTQVFAANPTDLEIAATYELPETGTNVSAVLDLDPAQSGDYSIDLPYTGLKNLKLVYTRSDNPLDVQLQEIDVVRAGRSIKASRLTFNLEKRSAELTFETESIAREYGSTLVFSLPAHSKQNIKMNRIDVIAPLSRGLAVAYAQKPSDTSIGSGQQTYQFNATDSQMPGISLLFGTATTAQINWQTRLANGSWWWQTKNLILPPDTNQQTVFLESITPRPTKLRVDRDGNLVAEYRIAPKKSVTVEAKALVYTRSLSYNTANTRTFIDTPDQLKGYITADPQSNDDIVVAKIQKIYEAKVVAINDQDALSNNGNDLVDEMYRDLQGAGVPTRKIHGIRMVAGGMFRQPYELTTWLESFVPGIGWMTLDPLSGLYGEADFQHIGLAITSAITDVNTATLDDGLSVNYGNDPLPPTDFSTTKVKLTKYLIFPGLSLIRAQVDMPAGSVLDGSAVSGGGVNAALGSLAPLQRVNHWAFGIGSAAMSGGEIEFGQGGDSGLGEVLARGPVEQSYIVIIVEVVALALIVAGVIQWRRMHKGSGISSFRRKTDEEDETPAEDLLESEDGQDTPGE